MPVESKVSVEKVGVGCPKAPLKRAPTLYLIIIFKLIKGVLACAFAVGLYFQSAQKLPQEYQQFLSKPIVVKTCHYLRIHPENKFFTQLAVRISSVTDAGVHEAAVGALLWALFPLAEGLGLLFRVPWAGWLAIVESAFFVPLEIHKLIEDFSWFMVVVTIINIGIVWYLFSNRERLFHHHILRAQPSCPTQV
jgi:uncharacterized membrane protein (DUF2068 family)